MNAPNRNPFAEFKREILEAVRHEMRGAALTLPREDVKPVGPHDSDVEQEILSALLIGHATVESLKPLESKHFYSTFNQHLFRFLSESPERDLQAITDAIDLCGPVLEELTTIRDCTPFAAAATLTRHVATVMNRWQERELIQKMQRIDAELRVGALTVDGAKLRLREFFMGRVG